MRGTPIVSYGSVTLLVRDAGGRAQRAMEADETLYLHPTRAATPVKSLIIGENDFPDVVLEVDHTTDVRPGKLLLYEAWGFPELWVVVPPGATRRRPAGVTIHRLVNGRYRSDANERRVSGLDGEGNPRRADRVGLLRRNLPRAGTRGAGRSASGRERAPTTIRCGACWANASWRRASRRAAPKAAPRAARKASRKAAQRNWRQTVRSLLRARGKRVSDAFTQRAPALVDTPRDTQ